MAAVSATFGFPSQVSAASRNSSLFASSQKLQLEIEHKWKPSFVVAASQDNSNPRNSGGSYRKVWRRRKLTKKDQMLQGNTMERVPFLEEQVRKIRDTGNVLSMDIERLLLSEDNRYQFVNEVAEEAKQYVDKNRDEYGFEKKAILHVLSNRMNDSGVYRPEAYIQRDPFKPGPGFMRQQLYDQTG